MHEVAHVDRLQEHHLHKYAAQQPNIASRSQQGEVHTGRRYTQKFETTPLLEGFRCFQFPVMLGYSYLNASAEIGSNTFDRRGLGGVEVDGWGHEGGMGVECLGIGCVSALPC